MRMALDYARRLDRLHLAPLPPFMTEIEKATQKTQDNALVVVGDLLGGLSRDGFHADLLAAMDDLETDCRVMDEAWLANDWWLKAQAIMAVVLVPQAQPAAMRVAA